MRVSAHEPGFGSSGGQTTVEESTWSVTMEAGMSVGGVGFSASAGVTGGQSYSFTMAKYTTYSGTVGGLVDQPSVNDYLYDFGMFVHTIAHSGYSGVQYQPIDFWTQDFSAGAPDCP